MNKKEFINNILKIHSVAVSAIDKKCKKCITVCPQKCIDYEEQKAYIKPKHCLKCGACKEICPVQAIEIK